MYHGDNDERRPISNVQVRTHGGAECGDSGHGGRDGTVTDEARKLVAVGVLGDGGHDHWFGLR